MIPMNEKKHYMSRREALKKGTMYMAATAMGTTFIPTLLQAGTTVRRIKDFNVLKYGAKGNGSALDTAAIQKAIDDAAAFGRGARVVLPGGYKFLSGTLEMKSRIEFHLADDAEIIASTNKEDYREDGLILAHQAEGLILSGTGNIDGQDLKFMSHFEEENEWWIPGDWRPKMFILTACKDLQVKEISFGNAPFWGLHMMGCEHVQVDHIRIRNKLNLPNCDGVDPDHCRDVEISNCDIVCGDDAVVVKATREGIQYGESSNIVVKDCVMKTQDSGVKIGTETTSDIHDITFQRCKILSSCRGCTIQLRDEGNVFDINFEDIEFVSRYQSDPWWGRGEAISFTAIPRTTDTNIGTIHDVKVKNVKGASENSVRINGTKESIIKNVSFENVAVTMNKTSEYKGGLFDNRPTKVYDGIEMHGNPGYSIRHADGVKLKNCSIQWGDSRPDYYTYALEADNVKNLGLSGFKGEAAHPDKFDDILVNPQK